MTIKVTAMSLQHGTPNRGGSRVMAHFDFITDDLCMKGCALALNPAAEWKVWTPLLEGRVTAADRRTASTCVYFRKEGSLEQRVLDAASEMYRRMGGEEPSDKFGELDEQGVWRTLKVAA